MMFKSILAVVISRSTTLTGKLITSCCETSVSQTLVSQRSFYGWKTKAHRENVLPKSIPRMWNKTVKPRALDFQSKQLVNRPGCKTQRKNTGLCTARC